MGVTFSYALFRAPLSAIDLTLRIDARTSIWQDALHMSAKMQAMLIAAVKSTDFLFGFLVGWSSDGLRSRFGRRRPFIALLFPIGVTSFFLFCSASYVFHTAKGEDVMPCVELVQHNATGHRNASACPVLKRCLEDAIARGLLEPSSGTNGTGRTPSHAANGTYPPEMAFAFALLYFLYILCTLTGSQIPYDALGMELEDDYHKRTKFFAWKAVAQFCGYLSHPLVGMVVAAATKDIAAQVVSKALCFGLLGLVAYVVLLCGVPEQSTTRKATVNAGMHLTNTHVQLTSTLGDRLTAEPAECAGNASTSTAIPLVPASRRALANRPYMRYLVMKVPLTLFSLIPSNMLSLFIKYNLAMEDWTFFQNACFAIAIVGGCLAIPMAASLARTLGKSRALALLLAVEGVFMLVCFVIPVDVYRASPGLTFLIMFFGGIGTSLPYTIPDSLLADIIDYDEMLSGRRSEGMYQVVETNLQQFVEIAGGVVPLMVLGTANYRPLGGCTCGCGIQCAEPYARWVCPGSVGYSCNGGLQSELLFAPEPDLAPCAAQTDGVLWTIQTFMVGIPGVFALFGACACGRLLITQEVHAEIRRTLDAANASRGAEAVAPRVDPLTKAVVTLPSNTPAALFKEHFSAFQLRQETSSPLGLKGYLGGRVLVWATAVVTIAALMATTDEQNVITAGCLALTALWVLIPWDGYRLYLLWASPRERLNELHSIGSAQHGRAVAGAQPRGVAARGEARPPDAFALSAIGVPASKPGSSSTPTPLAFSTADDLVVVASAAPPTPSAGGDIGSGTQCRILGACGCEGDDHQPAHDLL